MLTDIVTSVFLGNVFEQIIDVLPTLVPVTVAWVGIVKAIGWLKSTLYSA